RAFIKTRGESQTLESPAGSENFARLLSDYSDALAKNVWLEIFPAMLSSVVPVRRDKGWFLRDEAGEMLMIDPDFGEVWKLFAICGNQPRAVFAEFDGERLRPLGVWADGALTQL